MKKFTSFAIQMHITDKCPNECLHCYCGDHKVIMKNQISYDQFCTIINKLLVFEDIHNIRIGNFVLTGGDLFSNPDCFKIMEKLHYLGRRIILLGIPERVTESNLEKLKQLGITKYQVSLDGLKETHDRIRGYGSFNRTIEAIRMLYRNNMEPGIMYTVHSLNYKEMIPLIKFLNSQGINAIFAFDFLVDEGNAITNNVSMLNPDLAKKIIMEYCDLADKYSKENSSLVLNFKNPLLNLYHKSKINSIANNIKEGICGGCLGGVGSIAILADGNVLPCRRLPIEIGNIYTDSFEDIIINNSLMMKLRNTQNYKLCSTCRYVNICRGCPAIANSFNGDPFEPFPYCFMYEASNVNETYLTPTHISSDLFHIPLYQHDYNKLKSSRFSFDREAIFKINSVLLNNNTSSCDD